MENLQRAREHPEQFDEVFRESTATLLAELANLQDHRRPLQRFRQNAAPELETVDLNELVRESLRLFEAQIAGGRRHSSELDLDPRTCRHPGRSRANSARSAKPGAERHGRHARRGTLALRTAAVQCTVHLEVSDTGQGLTPKNASGCSRPTTPPNSTAPVWAWRSCNRW